MAGVTPTTTSKNHPHVLFAILDWGLGHATRTWPLILAARQSGAQVTVASRGPAAEWLQSRMNAVMAEEAPAGQLPKPWICLPKPGTHIQYAPGRWTSIKIAGQLPSFLRSISAEKRWLSAQLATGSITHVVSDNCYGACPARLGVSSALMTHQIAPPIPWWLRALANRQIRRWARPFDEVWVPDLDHGVLAGRLSVAKVPAVRFVGALSRFMPGIDGLGKAINAENIKGISEKSPPLVGMVSGPEPQRSLMEKALIACFLRDGRPAVIFSGKPEGGDRTEGQVQVVYNASDTRIRRALLLAESIVCRSGYSSLMDLIALNVVATLVPTPGQPEQEHLAHHWAMTWGWRVVQQKDLSKFHAEKAEGRLPATARTQGQAPFPWLQAWLYPHDPVPIKLQA